MINDINKLIREIPEAIRDCFYIELNQKYADKFIEYVNTKYKGYFVLHDEIGELITFKNIPIVISQYNTNRIKVKENIDSIIKVYHYEKVNITKYLNELENISNKYQCFIGGCGCCNSPYIDNLYTIGVCDINYNGKKLEYDLYIKHEYAEIIKEYYNV
jgi:hypothetical protein